MIRAALVGVSTVVGVGAVLSYQPAAEVVGAAVAPQAQQSAPAGTPAAAPEPTTAGSSSASEAGPTTSPAGPIPSAPASEAGTTAPSSAATPPADRSSPEPVPASRTTSPTHVPSTTRATPAPTASTTPTRTPTPTPTEDGPRTWTGAAAATPYGNVQVALVVDGGILVDAYALQFPSEHPTSREIASYALPELRRQTLEAQSAAIAGVSGASYDTAGWITSLQSALSRAGL